MNFHGYDTGAFFDEMFHVKGNARPANSSVVEQIESLSSGELRGKQTAAEQAMLDMGITFNVYGQRAGSEQIWPFDLIPRLINKAEWQRIERGLKQRIRALNEFINDVYNDQKIIKDGIVPGLIVHTSQGYLKQCAGLTPPRGIWCHITGTDLVRNEQGELLVLEDNLRCPSGVSYALANRYLMKRIFPEVFSSMNIRSVADYPAHLIDMLNWIAPEGVTDPLVTLLTPGICNSAYFEHTFLAQKTGANLVEGNDLVVRDGLVWMHTTGGLKRVDVIYRRINDEYLDPKEFRGDSLLGVPGLMEVYREGRVSLINAPGTGVADDKVIYYYVPAMIRYYLGEDPILPNVTTYLCCEPKSRQKVLSNLKNFVVKSANESGGYGMMIGPCASSDELENFRRRIKANPRNYIAQPVVSLSRSPVIVEDHFEGRHVDLRPFILYGQDIYVLPGGLTRVAFSKGSLVVNSSQGGGSKDTWVLAA